MGGPGSGFNAYTKTHVEGHAVALMHQGGITEAELTINNPVICRQCNRLLPRMLPSGAKLTVHLPDGRSVTFVGLP